VLLLGLDTATPAITVALHDGTRVLSGYTTVDKHRHAELLVPAIAQVLADGGADRADLTHVAVGVGPGPYTGLRVGVVTARVLGAALGIPVFGVCSLDVIAAESVLGGAPFLVATDARRRELYWASYDAAGWRVDGPHVSAPADIPVGDRPCAGEGPALYPQYFPDDRGLSYPRAATLCRCVAGVLATADQAVISGIAGGAGGAAPGDAAGGASAASGTIELLFPEPLYLRRPDAREPGAPKRVTETAPPQRAQSGGAPALGTGR
jgi:tRNA threonylcarbamoyl adenosine modification protein YeaZ